MILLFCMSRLFRSRGLRWCVGISHDSGFVGIQVTTLYKFDGILEFVLLLLVCVAGLPDSNDRQWG